MRSVSRRLRTVTRETSATVVAASGNWVYGRAGVGVSVYKADPKDGIDVSDPPGSLAGSSEFVDGGEWRQAKIVMDRGADAGDPGDRRRHHHRAWTWRRFQQGPARPDHLIGADHIHRIEPLEVLGGQGIDQVILVRIRHLTRCRDGRRNRYQIQAHAPLREPITRERTIGEVLDVLLGTNSLGAAGAAQDMLHAIEPLASPGDSAPAALSLQWAAIPRRWPMTTRRWNTPPSATRLRSMICARW